MTTAGSIPSSDITAVILAGGKTTRMGGPDRGLFEFGGRPMIREVNEAIAPQVGSLLISANRNLERCRGFGFPVVTDCTDVFAGPPAWLKAGGRRVGDRHRKQRLACADFAATPGAFAILNTADDERRYATPMTTARASGQ